MLDLNNTEQTYEEIVFKKCKMVLLSTQTNFSHSPAIYLHINVFFAKKKYF